MTNQAADQHQAPITDPCAESLHQLAQTAADASAAQAYCARLGMMSVVGRAAIAAFARTVKESTDRALTQLDQVDAFARTGKAPASYATQWAHGEDCEIGNLTCDLCAASTNPSPIALIDVIAGTLVGQAKAFSNAGIAVVDDVVTLEWLLATAIHQASQVSAPHVPALVDAVVAEMQAAVERATAPWARDAKVLTKRAKVLRIDAKRAKRVGGAR